MTVSTICSHCGAEFDCEKKQHTFAMRNGRSLYCSKWCFYAGRRKQSIKHADIEYGDEPVFNTAKERDAWYAALDAEEKKVRINLAKAS